MTVAEHWREPAAELEKFAEVIGLDPVKLDLTEWPDELVYDNTEFQTDALNLSEEPSVRAEKVNTLNQVFQNLTRKYGPALALRLNLGVEELIVNSALTVPGIESFCEAVTGSPFEIHLRINKQKLASHWDVAGPSSIFKIFLFPEALNRAVGVSLTELEGDKGLMRGMTGEHKLIVLVPDHNGIALNGDYLTVLGGEHVLRWKEYLPTAKPADALNKVRAIREHLRESPRWTGIELEYLTPLHLYVSWPDGGVAPGRDEPIAQGLFGQLLICSLLYMASTSRSGEIAGGGAAAPAMGDYPWTFTFSAKKYLARVEVTSKAVVRQALATSAGLSSWESCRKFGSLAKWVFEEERALVHRLAVIEVVIASSLQDNEPSANLSELVRRADDLTDRVWNRWDDFMEDKLGKYFLQLKQVEDAVTTTTNNHKDQIQTLTKSLTDNMLAAVGVVIGSFIAAIFKSPFENYIFWIGTGIYLVYLVVFPIGVGLVTAWQRFTDSRDGFSKSEREFAQRLSIAEVAQIVGNTVTVSERRFKKWFNFTWVSYALVVLLLLFAMWLLPHEIHRWSDNFEVNGLDYSRSQPPSSDVVPLIIRGANFDKDKEIVVKIGDGTFTNTDGQTLKVLGSSILTVTARQEDLTKARTQAGQAVSVTQGAAGSKTLSLPVDLAPIPKPTYDKWVIGGDNHSVQVFGSNLSAISEITYDNHKLKITPSTDLKTLVISEEVASKEPWPGRKLLVKLRNGETTPQDVSLTIDKKARRSNGE